MSITNTITNNSITSLPSELILKIAVYLPFINQIQSRSISQYWLDSVNDLLNQQCQNISWQIGVYYRMDNPFRFDVQDVFVTLGEVVSCPEPVELTDGLRLTIFQGKGGIHLQRAIQANPTVIMEFNPFTSSVSLIETANPDCSITNNTHEFDANRILGICDQEELTKLHPGVNWSETRSGIDYYTYCFALDEIDDDSVILSSEEGYSMGHGSDDDTEDEDSTFMLDDSFDDFFHERPSKRRRIDRVMIPMYDLSSSSHPNQNSPNSTTNPCSAIVIGQGYIHHVADESEEEDHDW